MANQEDTARTPQRALHGEGGWSGLIGQHVELRRGHPHAGCQGIVDKEGAGGVLVRLTDCDHGTDGCFVFHRHHLRLVHRSRR